MCLPMMWKILSVQIRGDIYYSLINRRLFLEEQKCCLKRTRGTREILYTDQHILKESKNEMENLGMAWINEKKAGCMVSQSWIIYCLKLYKLFDEVIKFIDKTMKNCRLKLNAGGTILAEVKNERGVFQGDTLSLLLFVIAMMPPNYKLRKCTGEYNRRNHRKRWII